MIRFVSWRGYRSVLIPLALAGAVAAASLARAASVEPPYSSAATIRVVLDQAKIIKMPDQTATLVVGNPLIADVSVQAGGIMVITGKSYGLTNVVALGRNGELLMQNAVEVESPGGNVVTLYRGVERETYSCSPQCEHRITIGDSATYFTNNLTQTGTLNTQAQGVVPK
jgi:Flp pilus assembly secretin CpaC